MDMAKNVTFAHKFMLNSMVKIGMKFDIPTCLVPCNQFIVW